MSIFFNLNGCPSLVYPKRGKEEIKRLSREEELAWIKNIRKNVLEACQMPKG